MSGGNGVTVGKGKAFVAFFFSGAHTYLLDKAGNIYQYTEREGLTLVTRLPHNPEDFKSGRHFVWNGHWVILAWERAYRFRPDTRTVEAVPDLPGGKYVTDNQGNHWVYRGTGMLYYVRQGNDTIRPLRMMSAERMKTINGERFHIVHDAHGLAWISTYGNGLFAYNPSDGSMTHYTYNIEGVNHIHSDFLLSLAGDAAGNIWAGSEYAGLSQLSVLNKGTRRIYPEGATRTDRSNTFRMVCRLPSGEIWAGNRRGGLFRYDAQMRPLAPPVYYPLSIFAVCEDGEGRRWMGSRGNGLYIDGRQYLHDDDNAQSLAHNHIYDLLCDRAGRVWIATFGGGLDLAVPHDGGYTFRHFLNRQFSESQVRTLTEDRQHRLWAGTNNGLYIFHPDSLIARPEAYTHYTLDNGLGSNEIRSIYCDSRGRVWIGTSTAGLSVCTPTADSTRLTFRHYRVNEGLVNNVVQAIVEDADGQLWISTEYGISRFNPDTEVFDNFLFSSTMPGNVYLESSACTLEDGRLLLGTNHGLELIDPRLVQPRRTASPVVLTGLRVNGAPVHPADNGSPLRQALCYTRSLTLAHNQNSPAISFSTFDYAQHGTTKYMYRLEPVEQEWGEPTLSNTAAYRHLAPGQYRLHVKACNASGVWSPEATTLAIDIRPPFWRTGWAYLLYALLMGAALWGAYRIVRKFSLLKHRIAVEKQLTEYKLRFFTNITHEFRTPLTLIQGALERLEYMGRPSREAASSLAVMQRNTRRMLRLINQLLEFRRMQAGRLTLALEEADVVAFVYEIYLNFTDTAAARRIDYRYDTSVASYYLSIDKGKVDKVVYNLLSNAFKYTPDEGQITCSVSVDEGTRCLLVSVTDTGAGIPEARRAQLFSRFMQSDYSGDSIGIGLHLAHELAQVHRGSLAYAPHEGGGSVFTLTLPLDQTAYAESDFLTPLTPVTDEADDQRTDDNRPARHTQAPRPEAETRPLNREKVLVIEDDKDIRAFLAQELSPYFEVETEADGTSGLARARSGEANLIVCDVLMPGLDGFEVTRRLKDDFETCHIPIILLTGMSTDESRLKGIESGADAYVTKPFSPRLLRARIFQLISQRDRLREKFSVDPSVQPHAICTSDRDKAFVDRLQQLIDERLGDPDFQLTDCIEQFNLSRSVFFRKIKGLTGYTPNEYVRTIRLKRAAALLLAGGHTVGEVAWQVGIKDPLYFSRCFKALFGVSPSAYGK